MNLRDLIARVDASPPQRELEIGSELGWQLTAEPEMERAGGLWPGDHWRAPRGAHGCYHLRILGDQAWLHWDRWDPRRYPLRHWLETSTLWDPLAGVGAILGRFR